jgi:hypothetical protein
MKMIADILPELVFPLDGEEAKILQLRFGLGIVRKLPPPRALLVHEGTPIGPNGHSLQEIGVMFGHDGEWIRTIQNRALAKIRHPSRLNKLLGFLDEIPPSKDAAVLIRSAYPDKFRLLRFKFGIRSEEELAADSTRAEDARRIIQLCYGDETTEQSKGPSVPGSRHARRPSLRREL